MQQRKLWPASGRLLVGISGGVDSMVLLRILHELAAMQRCTLVVAHFNHQLRGREATLDEKFVGKAAEALGLQFLSDRGDVRQFAAVQKVSIETAARTLRHDFLARTARGLGIKRIALAHHADDQVETFLLRLLRGAGSAGLAGMKWRAASPADSRIEIVRPLLNCTKMELTEFAREQRIIYREDKTNESLDMMRNRVRHELLPLLRKKYQPGIDAVLIRESELLRDESEFLCATAAQWLSSGRAGFRKLPVALQRRVLQLGLSRAGLGADFALVERMRETPGEWHTVSPTLQCRTNARGTIETRCIEKADFIQEQTEIKVGQRGEVRFAGVDFAWIVRSGNRMPKRTNSVEYFDADAVGEAITLRHWQPGDRFHPIGGSSAVKLQDLFVNQKVPREFRHKAVLALNSKGEIFWVEGMRIGEVCKVTAETRRLLELRWRRLQS